MSTASKLCLSLLAACFVGCSSGNAASPSRGDAGSDSATSDAAPTDAASVTDVDVTPVPLPSGAPGIGFDDLRYAPDLKKLLAPGGRSGNLDLVDPGTLAVTAIGGFSASSTFMLGSHAAGCTSADEGNGLLYAIDHETQSLRVVDPASKSMLASAMLQGGPDYVRWVEPTSEVWVTEPLAGIEVLSATDGGAPLHAMTISVAAGPEAIAVDNTRQRVYTNSFIGQTFAIDVSTHAIVETWANGCSTSLGVAVDEARGFVFVACSSGTVVVLDAAHGGTKLDQLTRSSDFDIISFSSSLHHLYVPGGTSADLAIIGVSASGKLSLLDTVPTAQGSKEVTADDKGNVWVADQSSGRLLKIVDPFPATP